MRALLAIAIVGALALGALGCRTEADRKLDPLLPLIDEMCACHDKACGDGVAVAYQAWFAAHGSDATGALNAKQATRFQDMVGSLETCRSKAGGSDSLLP